MLFNLRLYGRAADFDADCPVRYDPENSVFPPRVEIGFTEENYAKLTDDFKILEKNLNWISFGKLILRVYYHCMDNNYSLVSWYEWKDWVQEQSTEPHEFAQPAQVDIEMIEDVKVNGHGSSDNVQINGEIESHSPPKVSENKDEVENGDCDSEAPDQEKKANNRRRCSDLDFLKEWGWHKNRRSSRKKQKDEEESGDTTVNGFIRRILPNYFVQSFDSNRSPFAQACDEIKSLDDSYTQNQSKSGAEDEEKFYELTKDSFEEFMSTFKDREFDVAIPMFQWLRFVSLYWDKTIIPSEILSLFKKIYKLYEGFVDYHSMYHLDEEDFKSTFRMALFYFELQLDEFEDTKTEIPEDYIRKKDFLQLNIGFVDEDIECTEMLTRLIWLSYLMQIHNNNFKDALGYLYKLEEVYEVPKYSEISVELKNCKHNKLIDCKTVKELIVKIERKINLASVQHLYESQNHQNFEELIEILRESIIYSTEPKVNTDHLTLKIQTQIEVFLECLWALNRISECLMYAEKSLCYAFDNFALAPTEYRLEEWASLVNYCLVYIDAAIKDEEGSDILYTLENNLSRLVQTLSQIITHQLDTPAEKNNTKSHLLNLTIPWTILYHLVLRENDISSALNRKKADDSGEEDFETLPNSILMFFTAHESLGRKQWCMKDNGKLLINLLDILAPIYRTPLLEPYRDIITEHLEQTTYCLYGFPIKKAKLRHIEEHDAKNIDLTWELAIQLFDLYRPDTLPEFDSYKLASINVEMEQLLQKILPLIPRCIDIAPFTGEIRKFINGSKPDLPKGTNILPAKIASIYYLLADFYFKNQETGKAIKFYINDLTMKPDRFDSWASLSLCKQSKLEMKLNSNASISVKDFLDFADQAINCFNQCLKLKRTITILTEFASFTYHLHSFCSRNLKQSSETLSMENFSAIEERKDKFLNISLKSFSEVSEAVNDPNHELNVNKNQEESDDNHDDKWYYHFMLGKIAEKKKQQPIKYLEHYQKAAKYLYDDNATYPIKINHGNPPHLAIESLEVFYRISACIMKYLEQHSKINKPTAKLFMRVLKDVATSPFAFNRAKINKGNISAMKHKLNTTGNEAGPAKQPKIEENTSENKTDETAPLPQELKMETDEIPVDLAKIDSENEIKTDAPHNEELSTIVKLEEVQPKIETPEIVEPSIQPVIKTIIAESAKSSRSGSQESAVTTNTTTSNPSSTSSDSSADSSSDSDSSSSDETDGTDKENVFVEQDVIDNIYKLCIKNLEECVSRFPEHYKSIYRLVHHFSNIGESMEKCKQLLLSSNYKTTLGNSIGGLFSERKNNNFFNGIWRVPTQEIDRPGNFTTHLSKCVVILMEVLKKSNDYDTLVDLALQLQRNPEADKKYLNDADKKELFHQAVTCCVQAFKNKLREIPTENSEDRSRELLSLMLDIFKTHRKTQKILQQKDQSLFSGVLVEVYKEYVKDRMGLPDNANMTDLAFKLCQQELNYRKNLEKGIVTTNPNPPMPQFQQQAAPTSSPILVKSVSEINKTISNTSAGQTTPSPQTNPATNQTASKSISQSSGSSARTKPRSSGGTSKSQTATMNSMLMSLYTNPALFAQLTDSTTYMNEYYKTLQQASPSTSSATSSANLLSGLTPQQLMASLYPSLATQSQSPSPSSSKSNSNFEKKYMESLKNIAYSSNTKANLLGLQQNLLSNSLTITTTTITPTTSSKLSKSSSKSSASGSSKQANTASVSITKSDSKKYSSMLASNLKLPDLPKSLSITPSMPTANTKSNRVSDKTKSSREKTNPANSFNVNSALSITPESFASSKKASDMQASYQADMQASYQAFLKNYSQTAPIAATKKSSPINVSSSSASLLKPTKHKSSSQLTGGTAKKSHMQQPSKSVAQLPYDFGKNIASSFSGHPMSSPTLSSSPFSQHTTPPLANSPSLLNLSPQKTLQQKLAERKQQNQPQKKKSGKLTYNSLVDRQ